jgi:hypothetical protein
MVVVVLGYLSDLGSPRLHSDELLHEGAVCATYRRRRSATVTTAVLGCSVVHVELQELLPG